MNMNKELFIQFIKILERRAEKLEDNQEYHYSEEDLSILQQLTALVEQDPSVKDLLYDIRASSSEAERYQKVENYFNEKSNPKSVDELIAETLDVDVSKIDHYYLQNGHEILSFYSSKLERTLFLKVNSDGKNVKEYLEDLRKKSEKYQTENAENTLMNERNDNDIEVKWYDKKDLAYLYDIANDMTDKQDLKKFRYLLEQLASDHISCINLEDFIYLDNQNKIGEISLVNGEILDMSPANEESKAISFDIDEDLAYSSLENTLENRELGEKAIQETGNISDGAVESMLEQEDNVKKEKEESAKVYTYHSDSRSTNSNGYGTIVVFAVIISIFIIGIIFYLVFH